MAKVRIFSQAGKPVRLGKTHLVSADVPLELDESLVGVELKQLAKDGIIKIVRVHATSPAPTKAKVKPKPVAEAPKKVAKKAKEEPVKVEKPAPAPPEPAAEEPEPKAEVPAEDTTKDGADEKPASEA